MLELYCQFKNIIPMPFSRLLLTAQSVGHVKSLQGPFSMANVVLQTVTVSEVSVA